MANELRKGPSGPLADSAGDGRVLIERAALEITASFTLGTAGTTASTFLAVGTANGAPAEASVSFADCEVGDVIEVEGQWRGNSGSTVFFSTLKIQSNQGGAGLADVTPALESVKAGNGATDSNLAAALQTTFSGSFVIATAGTCIVQALASKSTTGAIDVPANGLSFVAHRFSPIDSL